MRFVPLFICLLNTSMLGLISISTSYNPEIVRSKQLQAHCKCFSQNIKFYPIKLIKEETVAMYSHESFSNMSKRGYIVRFHDRVTMFWKPGFSFQAHGSFFYSLNSSCRLRFRSTHFCRIRDGGGTGHPPTTNNLRRTKLTSAQTIYHWERQSNSV